VVLLTDKDQNSILPIWIGLCEARSIELGISEKVAPRPLTYDMMAAIIRTIGAKVERIVIVDLRDEVFYAQVEVSVDGKVSKIDARPSDAIALASRMNSPIYVKKTVLDKASLLDKDKEKRGL
jgi:bifunctional DNase/RNase